MHCCDCNYKKTNIERKICCSHYSFAKPKLIETIFKSFSKVFNQDFILIESPGWCPLLKKKINKMEYVKITK